MSFRIRKKPIRREVLRVAREVLECSLKEVLTVGDQSRSTAVHEARKQLKILRALLRLVRPATGNAFYKRENAALREVAQTMSPIRDSHVRVQTVDKLIASSKTRRPPAALARVRAAMLARLDQVLDEGENGDWCKKAAAELEQALCRLPKFPVRKLTAGSLRTSLKAGCKQARRALQVAQRDRTDENLHELRKAVKILWYDLSLLEGNRPPAIKSSIKEMRDLGEKLGNDHDLAMLMAARAENPLPQPADWETVENAIARRRPLLQRAALRLATKALSRKPGVFADFVLDRWNSWRR
jgi:CHAD domain-containing protein